MDISFIDQSFQSLIYASTSIFHLLSSLHSEYNLLQSSKIDVLLSVLKVFLGTNCKLKRNK